MPVDAEFAYLFRHALLRVAAYELQLPRDRARLHGLAVEIIEELWGSEDSGIESLAPELADHARLALEDSALPEPESVRLRTKLERYLGLGADFCSRQHRASEAARLYTQLAEVAAEPAARANALAHAGNTSRMATRYNESVEAFRRGAALARELGDEALLVECLTGEAGVCMLRTEFEAAETLLREAEPALDTLKQGVARSMVLLLRARLGQQRDRMDDAVRDMKLAIGALRDAAHKPRLMFALTDLNAICVMLRRLEDADAASAEGIALGRELDSDWHLGTALLHRAYYLRVAGEFQAAEPLYKEAAQRLQACGNLFDLGWTWCDFGGLLHQSGRLSEAVPRYRSAREVFGEIESMEGWATASNNLGLCLVELGRFDEAQALLDAVVEFGERSGANWRQAEYLTNRGVLESDRGNIDTSMETTARALELSRGANPSFEPINLGNLARLRWFTGRLDEAAEGLAAAVELSAKLELPFFEGLYRAEHAGFLLCTGRGDAHAELITAEEILNRVGARREWAARVAPVKARLQFIDGDFDAAEETLQQAEETLVAGGIEPQAFSRRALQETGECLEAARNGDSLLRGYRAAGMDPRLRRALGVD